jgi:hypothetical protein
MIMLKKTSLCHVHFSMQKCVVYYGSISAAFWGMQCCEFGIRDPNKTFSGSATLGLCVCFFNVFSLVEGLESD